MDDKKYHMDLKENARGRFLKVSETFTRGYSRFQVRNYIKHKSIESIFHNNLMYYRDRIVPNIKRYKYRFFPLLH